MMRQRVAIPLLALCLPLAYILPAEHQLSKMAEKRAALKFTSLKVTLECTSGEKKVEQTLYLKTPGMVRREAEGRPLEICRRSQCLEPGAPAPLPAWRYLLWWFFVDKADAEAYQELLKGLKINLRTDTLSRFAGRIAVVLGAKAWEGQRPQFWLDKNLFLPLRLIVEDKGEMVEIAWRGWGSRSAGEWFPQELEVRRGGNPLLSCTTLEVKSGVDLPDSLFRP